MNDELEGIFDDLNPADFAEETTALHEASREQRSFEEFVQENIRAIHTAFGASNAEMQLWVILANPEKYRLFIPLDDETIKEYVDRLHGEAKKMKANRVFLAYQTLLDNRLVTQDELHDAADLNLIEQLGEENMREGVLWYAEEVGHETRVGGLYRFGLRLQFPVQTKNQKLEVFGTILRDL